MSPDILVNAAQLIKLGSNAEAHRLLEPLVRHDPCNLKAWSLYIKSCATEQAKIEALEQCLVHNPNNQNIQELLATLKARRSAKSSTMSSASPQKTRTAQLPTESAASALGNSSTSSSEQIRSSSAQNSESLRGRNLVQVLSILAIVVLSGALVWLRMDNAHMRDAIDQMQKKIASIQIDTTALSAGLSDLTSTVNHNAAVFNDFVSSLRYSDARLKQNVAILRGALQGVLDLRGVTFNWNLEKFPGKSANTQIGVIAQDVEKIFPDLVTTDADGYKLVNYDGLVAVLIEAVKEQQKTIDTQQKSIQTLQQQNQDLNARIDLLEKSGKPQSKVN